MAQLIFVRHRRQWGDLSPRPKRNHYKIWVFQTGPGLQPFSTDFVNESYFMQFSKLNSHAIRIENAINI